MAVTLKDVARESGVSAHSVSAVLNGKAKQYRISEATSQRVEEMALQMGYNPENNQGARQMAARKHGVRIPNNVIAVISLMDPLTMEGLPDQPYAAALHSHPYDNEFLQGIELEANDHELDVLICRHASTKLPRLIEKGEVDGVIPLASNTPVREKIAALGLPAVSLVIESHDFHSVVVAHYQGMYDSVKYLTGLGHKTIAYVGHSITFETADQIVLQTSCERYRGYCEAMADAGLEAEFVDIGMCAQSMELAGDAIEALWAQSEGQITAVVCYNDIFAMGVIRRLERLGLQIPLDVSVTGFDDISLQYMFQPSITSVYYDRRKMGRRAVEVLWNLREEWLTGRPVELMHEIAPVELVVRGSTAPPR